MPAGMRTAPRLTTPLSTRKPARKALRNGKDEEKVERLEIELEGLEERARLLPVAAGNYGSLQAGERKVFYVNRRGSGETDSLSLSLYDLEAEEETELLPDVGGYALTPDASQMLVFAQGADLRHHRGSRRSTGNARRYAGHAGTDRPASGVGADHARRLAHLARLLLRSQHARRRLGRAA